MLDAMGTNSRISGIVCYNPSADPNNLRDDHSKHFICRNPVACNEFVMRQPAFTKQMSYALAKEFDDAEEHIYSEVKTSDWWCNEQVW